jgi:hypothetical protein
MSDLPDWSGRNNEVPHASPGHFLEIFAVAIRVEAEARSPADYNVGSRVHGGGPFDDTQEVGRPDQDPIDAMQ